MNLSDWKDIALSLGSIDENGNESSLSDKTNKAIELMLGEDSLRKSVHYYIDGKPGSELLRGVLWQLHPWSAMEECYKVFKTNDDVQCKRNTVEL